jgi:hypothetical protein
MLTYLRITLHGQYYSSTTNLPPWLTTKKTFCDVNLVYTREGDRKKWEHRCVSTTSDVTKPRGSFEFMLRAICMWSLPDYLAYGLFVSCQTKGYLACLFCSPKVDIRCSSHLKKNLYLGHWHYHARGHPYRRDHDVFNWQVELKSTPPRVSAIKFLQRVEEREAWLARRFHTLEDREDLVHTRDVKRKSLFFCLPYWQVEFCWSTISKCIISFPILSHNNPKFINP